MGAPPVPNELKRKRGTLRADRVGTLRASLINSGEVPTPPETLGEVGLEHWERIWKAASAWISQASDFPLVALTCELFDEREELRELLESDPQNYRQRIALRELEKSLIRNLSLLGLSPADRSRLGFIEVRRESKLEELRRKLEGD